MERKQLRTYNGKGRQNDVCSSAGTWSEVFGSPVNKLNYAPQGCTTNVREPVSKKNRHIRNRVKKTVVDKENMDISTFLESSSTENRQGSLVRSNPLFFDVSVDDSVKLSKLKARAAEDMQTKTKVKKQNSKQETTRKTNKKKIGGRVSTEECTKRETKHVPAEAPTVPSFSEFDEYALHISTECPKYNNNNPMVNHKNHNQSNCVTDESIKLLRTEAVKTIIMKKLTNGRKKKAGLQSAASDADVSSKPVEIEAFAEPEISRSAELHMEYSGNWCTGPVEFIREASCIEDRTSEHFTHVPQDSFYPSNVLSLCSTKGERLNRSCSLMEPSSVLSDTTSIAMTRRRCNKGLTLTSTPQHLAVCQRVTRSQSQSICSSMQLSGIESVFGCDDAESCSPPMTARSDEFLHSVDLFPLSPPEVRHPVSCFGELKDVIENVQSSLEYVLSLEQYSSRSKLTTRNLSTDSTNKEISGLHCDSDNQCSIGNEKTSNCDRMSVSEVVLDLSEIIEEEEQQNFSDEVEIDDVDGSCVTQVVEGDNVHCVARCPGKCDCKNSSHDISPQMSDCRCGCSAVHSRICSIGNCATPSKYKLNYITQELQQSAQSFVEMLSPVPRKPVKPMTFKEKVLLQCEQSEPIPFEEFISDSDFEITKKIGEGVYGEVFSAVHSQGDLVALKIIPIEGRLKVNDEVQKSFEEILPEIMISKELSSLRTGTNNQSENFVFVRSVHCLQGRYPGSLLKLWDDYDEAKQSQNDRPASFPARQLYIVFEFENSGSDLESVKLNTMAEAKTVLKQVAVSLAVAEKALNFEHRDLHRGNVLIARSEKKRLEYLLDDRVVLVESEGIKVAIIDFTLSRLTKEGCDVYTNLATDPALFEGHGDLQFDVYREMQNINGNNWQKYDPKTNVLWVDYLCDKLLSHKKYSESSTNRAEHSGLRKEFQQLRKVIADYDSTCDLVTNHPFFSCF